MKKQLIIILSLAILLTLSSCKSNVSNFSSALDFKKDATENSSSVETPTKEENTVVEEPSKEAVTSKEEATAPVQTPSQAETTTSETPPKQTQPSKTETQPSVKVVQLADPETGISWDGVSPIIYTYPDGTTGTEKREGATYEQVPGMWTTVVTVKKVDYDGTCAHCGKEEGRGDNNTCLRPYGGEMNCPSCGKHLEANVCHTCDE